VSGKWPGRAWGVGAAYLGRWHSDNLGLVWAVRYRCLLICRSTCLHTIHVLPFHCLPHPLAHLQQRGAWPAPWCVRCARSFGQAGLQTGKGTQKSCNSIYGACTQTIFPHRHTHAHTHTRTHAHAHMMARTHMHIHSNAQTDTCTHIHTPTRACAQTHMHARAHTCAHVHTHEFKHTHMRTPTRYRATAHFKARLPWHLVYVSQEGLKAACSTWGR